MTTRIAELEAIQKVANQYGEALQNGDVELLKQTFYEKSMMFGFVSAGPMIVEIQGLFDYVASSPPPAQSGEPHRYYITKIDFGGRTASVEMIQESYQGVDYINYFQLLKIDGNWKIVSKSFDVIASDKTPDKEKFTYKHAEA